MKTSFYVDGFNFYYGVFRRNSPIAVPADKWLDWRTLATKLVAPGDVVHKIHYCTARIERMHNDPEQGLRQETYFRVLRRVPGVEFHFGKYKRRPQKGELITPSPVSLGLPAGFIVKIMRNEEKGSDVNLATRLVEDSYEGKIEHAIVVSNDTDLIAPILSARKRIRVSVVSPHPLLAPDLRQAADVGWIMDTGLLRECRLSSPALDDAGDWVYPPESWQLEQWPDCQQS